MIATTPVQLLARLDAVGESLRDSGHALALIGLGSVGRDTDRIDRYSDLDFFVIAEPGQKHRYIDHLDWLNAAHAIGWHFRNTPDGHKALMTDGVFCEFAVFEPHELDPIPYTPGRIVWSRPGVDPGIAMPRRPLPAAALPDETWIVGEALSNLLVGLQRWHRGEKLSAARLIQVHTVDRLIELDALRAPPDDSAARADPFGRDRRIERRQPSLAAELGALMPGYEKTPEAAIALLAALERRGAVLNAFVADSIRGLAAR